MTFWSQDLSARCANYFWGVTVHRTSQWTELEQYVCTHTHICIYFCLFIYIASSLPPPSSPKAVYLKKPWILTSPFPIQYQRVHFSFLPFYNCKSLLRQWEIWISGFDIFICKQSFTALVTTASQECLSFPVSLHQLLLDHPFLPMFFLTCSGGATPSCGCPFILWALSPHARLFLPNVDVLLTLHRLSHLLWSPVDFPLPVWRLTLPHPTSHLWL